MFFYRKSILFSFLSAFLFQVIGYNLLLSGSVWLCKLEEREGNIISLKLTQEDFDKAILNESELQLHEDLYDVINVSKEKDCIKVICKKDEKEKDLLEKITEHLKKQGKQKKGISFSTTLCDTRNYEDLSFSAFDKLIKHYYQSDNKLFSRYIDYTSPPPKA